MTIRGILLVFMNIVFGIIEVILGLRVILRLFGAGTGNAFANWVYDTSATLVAPFRGIFPTTTLGDGFAIDFTALFAMLVYALIYLLIVQLLNLLLVDRHEPVYYERVDDRDHRDHDHYR